MVEKEEEDRPFPEKLSEHITDKEARDYAEYYIRQFARLHQFPTCLGKAIQAYDCARELLPEDREAMELLFENLSNYIDPLTKDQVSVESHLKDIEKYAAKLRSSSRANEIYIVISNLQGSFPANLSHFPYYYPRGSRI